MKQKFVWIVVGGLSFWLPETLAAAALHHNENIVVLNIVPLAGLIVLGATSWICTKHFPKWGWVLAGIYILGPVCMMGPALFVQVPHSPSNFGGNLLLILLFLFPPTTLWYSLLNWTIFSVLVATGTLPFLAIYQKGQSSQPDSPILH